MPTEEDRIKQRTILAVDKIIKEVKKNFTISYMETFEGYVDDVTHFRIEELPSWSFAIWPLEQLGEEGLWTFCEHDNLIDKFKRGRCYNDEAFNYLSKYIQDIKDIVADEEKHYYISDGSMEDDYFLENGGYSSEIEVVWNEQTMRDKAHDLYEMDRKVLNKEKI